MTTSTYWQKLNDPQLLSRLFRKTNYAPWAAMDRNVYESELDEKKKFAVANEVYSRVCGRGSVGRSVKLEEPRSKQVSKGVCV
jgi:hypothetical protein